MTQLDTSRATLLVEEHYPISGTLEALVGYADLNYRLTTTTGSFVVKFSKADSEGIEKEIQMMNVLEQAESSQVFPHKIKSKNGNDFETIRIDDENWIVRIISWLDGTLWVKSRPTIELLRDLGDQLGAMDKALYESGLWVGAREADPWYLRNASLSRKHLPHIEDVEIRRLAHYFLQQFELNHLPHMESFRTCMIHGDVNDYNLLVSDNRLSGIFDFGDANYAPVIHDLAIAMTYAFIGQENLLLASKAIVESYHFRFPLEKKEIEALYWLIGARLSVTVCQAAHSRFSDPDNAYRLVSEEPAKILLRQWVAINPIGFTRSLLAHLGLDDSDLSDLEALKRDRLKHVNPSLSISFLEPIKMSRAAFQYMYAEDGYAYLDCVNNICHVGHCHPKVVDAASRQMATLNTNTRYLYDSLNNYARRLADRFPNPLDVVYLVNSGSEAGDLAQRIVRTITGHKITIVVDHAYHGNTLAGIEVSPYKYKGKGGSGRQNHIHQLPSPDSFSSEDIKQNRHVKGVEEVIKQHPDIAAFYCESIVGCGGQVVLPDGYLSGIYAAVRAAGGYCIADEVQVGFGRVGDAFWGFELQDVVPDIVVIGKPMGNGHPMAAVVTTAEIANRFNNGMEYFSSFGGNPVSCEIGLAVLDVIEEEQLQTHARQTGNYFMSELRKLQQTDGRISDVRGHGLFIGVELEADGKPATDFAKTLVEYMKGKRIMLSLDGPYNNVIKIKPPMTFNQSNVDEVVLNLSDFLRSH